MKRVVWMVLVIALVLPSLTACGSTARARWSTPSPEPSAAPSAPAASPSASGGTDTVKDCFDGDCLLRVSKPTVVPLHIKYGITRLEITAIDADTVTIQLSFGAGAGGETTGSAGSTLTVNKLVIRVVSVDGGTAVLDFTP